MQGVNKRLLFLLSVMLLVLALIPFAGYSKKKTPINLTVYTETTDYLGTQDGWFAKVLWDKFKVKLKIVNEYEGRSPEQINPVIGVISAYLEMMKVNILMQSIMEYFLTGIRISSYLFTVNT